MALYKHVSNKDEMLDGMVDIVVREIDPPADGNDWKNGNGSSRPAERCSAILGPPE